MINYFIINLALYFISTLYIGSILAIHWFSNITPRTRDVPLSDAEDCNRRSRRKNSPTAMLKEERRRVMREELPPAYRSPLKGMSMRLVDERVPKRVDKRGRIVASTVTEEATTEILRQRMQ